MKTTAVRLAEHRTLEGERLLLRPIRLDDAADMTEYTSDEETTRFIFAEPKNFEQTERLIANYYLREPIGKFALVLKSEQKLIGSIEFRVDDSTRSADLGFTLSRHYWGNGYMTEAGLLILGLAFDVLGLERVHAAHETGNVNSGRMMLRLGMTHEGTRRKDHLSNGKLVDSAYYSILKEEYEAGR
ncbi:GNAT family N-acetyltransferase [Saccharibacillus sp. CPCC 101409]|uniref:GNAT family N-acetyltransferase n=1 Tax=Saccharibacillus sp. CPCC 101409 TaxID=3058041 RepID=UPI0026719BFF|nr:GNAT family N-acetyltransferase [Saccharibacillus sp. CPCC 101409]MDO3413035.1 GNAT family N-acetyltransferase [Saccharibacillus sp. CPCC 101409]